MQISELVPLSGAPRVVAKHGDTGAVGTIGAHERRMLAHNEMHEPGSALPLRRRHGANNCLLQYLPDTRAPGPSSAWATPLRSPLGSGTCAQIETTAHQPLGIVQHVQSGSREGGAILLIGEEPQLMMFREL